MASYRLKRKTFAFLGIGNVAKNWNAAKGLWGAGNKMAALGSAAKAGLTGALYTGAAGATLAGGATLYGSKKTADALTGNIGTDY